MSKNRQPRMALCPIGKFVFSHERAIENKKRIQTKLRDWQIDFIDLDDIVEDGLIRDKSHVAPALKHFRASDADCLFVPHCNFGTEDAVGLLARDLGVPVLLWGPRDDSPNTDGTRSCDTLCGMFASSGVMRKLGVDFTYIENSAIDGPEFRIGVDRFIRSVNVADALRRGTRIGLIGQRIDFFWSTIINENELLDRFHVEVLPIDMVDFIGQVRKRVDENGDKYAQEAGKIHEQCVVEGLQDDAPLTNILAVRDQMIAVAEDNDLEALAVQDFTSLVDAMNAYCFYANAMVAEHIPIGIESDIHGALSNILLKRAALGEPPTYLVDVTIRHPDNDNGVLLWHAGAPPSMLHPDDKIKLGHHWILPSPLAGMPHFRMKDGDITVARFERDSDNYKLAVGEGRSIDGPATQNNYVWMEVDDWPNWERTLIEGPFIHHIGMLYGHYGQAIEEACRYVPGLEPVRLNCEWE